MGVTLTLTPAAFWALAKVADRHGPLTVSTGGDGRVLALVATTSRVVPDVALELDAEGRVVGKTLLRWPQPEREPDGLDDFGEERHERPDLLEPLHQGAKLAGRCSCEVPRWNGYGGCQRCGRPLPSGLLTNC